MNIQKVLSTITFWEKKIKLKNLCLLEISNSKSV